MVQTVHEIIQAMLLTLRPAGVTAPPLAHELSDIVSPQVVQLQIQ